MERLQVLNVLLAAYEDLPEPDVEYIRELHQKRRRNLPAFFALRKVKLVVNCHCPARAVQTQQQLSDANSPICD